eukprot:TRINITY_DN20703_c0_g1_i1.p1 TRINITY_DN20703_c0_g1~~TRINITY_DN20703_c0_g1_i1.p1  ORF type:complete len:1017 (-),score=192.72 TRINITY_DN20703_c0_g1_i1:312-3005(-)
MVGALGRWREEPAWPAATFKTSSNGGVPESAADGGATVKLQEHPRAGGLADRRFPKEASLAHARESSVGAIPGLVMAHLQSVVAEFTAPQLWGLPTELAAYDSGEGSLLRRTPRTEDEAEEQDEEEAHDGGNAEAIHQSLAANAVLQQAALDGIARLALDVGPRFVEGACAVIELLPLLLERWGESYGAADSSSSSSRVLVGRSAQGALRVLSLCCGCTSVGVLLAENSDVVVEVLCRGLRHLDFHPQAPQLLAAVLREPGAALRLLPVLHEPMQAVLKGLQVVARRRHPHHTLAFVEALREIATAAAIQASEVDSCSRAAAEACEDIAAKVSGATEVDLANASDERIAAAANEGAHLEAVSRVWDVETLEEARRDRRKRRLTLAALATSCVDAAAPLAAAQDMRVRHVALDTVEEAIIALSRLESAIGGDRRERAAVGRIAECVWKPRGADGWQDAVEAASADEDAPGEGDQSLRVLPNIHAVWPYVVVALRSHALPTVVRALALLEALFRAGGGGFMARRIRDDAWPVLQRLLRDGAPLPMPPTLRGGVSLPRGTPLLTVLSNDPRKAAPELLDNFTSAEERRRTLVTLSLHSPAVSVATLDEKSTDEGSPVRTGGASLGSHSSLSCIENRGAGGSKRSGGSESNESCSGSVLRLRMAVLGFITATASRSDTNSALQPVARLAAASAVPFLDKREPPSLQQAAVDVLTAMVDVDRNAVTPIVRDLLSRQTHGNSEQRGRRAVVGIIEANCEAGSSQHLCLPFQNDNASVICSDNLGHDRGVTNGGEPSYKHKGTSSVLGKEGGLKQDEYGLVAGADTGNEESNVDGEVARGRVLAGGQLSCRSEIAVWKHLLTNGAAAHRDVIMQPEIVRQIVVRIQGVAEPTGFGGKDGNKDGV